MDYIANRYKIIGSSLGKGANGVVELAYDTTDKELVAIK